MATDEAAYLPWSCLLRQRLKLKVCIKEGKSLMDTVAMCKMCEQKGLEKREKNGTEMCGGPVGSRKSKTGRSRGNCEAMGCGNDSCNSQDICFMHFP